jgi:tetratricopeptide (TPR) repeat protein
MLNGILFFIATLLSYPALRIINLPQIAFIGLISVFFTARYFKKYIINKKFILNPEVYFVLIMLLAISYNLKGLDGTVHYVPLAQFILLLGYFCANLYSAKIKGIGLKEQFLSIKKGGAWLFIISFLFLFIFSVVALFSYLAAYKLSQKGSVLFDAGEILESRSFFEKALALKPNLYRAYPRFFNSLFVRREYNDLIETCLKFKPYLSNTSEHSNMFYFYLGSAYLRNMEFDEAITTYDKLISIDDGKYIGPAISGLSEFYFYQGQRYARLRDWGSAFKEYTIASGMEPEFNYYSFKVGEAEYFLGKKDSAIAVFENLLKQGFRHKDIFLYCAQYYESISQFDKAINMCVQLSKFSPEKDKGRINYLNAYSAMGRIYDEAGRPDLAVESYEKLFDFDNFKPYAYRLLGPVYIKSGQFDKAIAVYNNLLVYKDFAAEAYLLTGDAYFWSHDYSKAKMYYQKACSADKSPEKRVYSLAVKQLGGICIKNGDLDNAVKWYSNLSRYKPSDMY